MQNQQQIIDDLSKKIMKLQSDFNDLSSAFYSNNFSGSQIFTKNIICNTRFRVPVYTGAPTTAEVGDLIAVGGKLYICSAINPVVFTLVGSQT